MTDHGNTSVNRRFSYQCECGRSISIYDIDFHRNVVCPLGGGSS